MGRCAQRRARMAARCTVLSMALSTAVASTRVVSIWIERRSCSCERQLANISAAANTPTGSTPSSRTWNRCERMPRFMRAAIVAAVHAGLHRENPYSFVLRCFQRRAHAVGIVADDAVQLEREHAPDFFGLVHRPCDDAQAQLARLCHPGHIEVAEIGRPEARAGLVQLRRIRILPGGQVGGGDLRRLALDHLEGAEIE